VELLAEALALVEALTEADGESLPEHIVSPYPSSQHKLSQIPSSTFATLQYGWVPGSKVGINSTIPYIPITGLVSAFSHRHSCSKSIDASLKSSTIFFLRNLEVLSIQDSIEL